MRDSIRVQTQMLEEGMILARDVEKDGLLLVASGNKLTRKMIMQFLHSKIPAVWVYDGSETTNLRLYEKNYNQIQNIVLAAAEGQPLALKEVEAVVDSLINARFKRSLLRYIYGIRKVDEYTFQHSLNVSYLAMMLGSWAGYPNINHLAMAGLLHDLGKVRVDSKILNKPGSLTEKEWVEMKRHSYLGYDLLLSSPEISKEVQCGVLYHHERVDGSGYPQGLQGDKIPEIARIVAIVDVFDAMTSDRVYRDKRDVFEVLQYLHDRHHDFDLRFLQIFTRNMLDILVGEEVLLSNNKVGKIVFTNQYKPFSPLVLTDEGFIDLAQQTNVKVARVI